MPFQLLPLMSAHVLLISYLLDMFIRQLIFYLDIAPICVLREMFLNVPR